MLKAKTAQARAPYKNRNASSVCVGQATHGRNWGLRVSIELSFYLSGRSTKEPSDVGASMNSGQHLTYKSGAAVSGAEVVKIHG